MERLDSLPPHVRGGTRKPRAITSKSRSAGPTPTPSPPPKSKPPKTDYRPALAELIGALSLAGGLAPLPKIQAQATVLNVHVTELANGINAIASSSSLAERGLRWLCGTPGTDNTGNAGLFVAVAMLAPFAHTTYQLWSPPPKKLKDGTPNPAFAEYENVVKHWASIAEENSRKFMEQAMEQFEAAQAEAEENDAASG